MSFILIALLEANDPSSPGLGNVKVATFNTSSVMVPEEAPELRTSELVAT